MVIESGYISQSEFFMTTLCWVFPADDLFEMANIYLKHFFTCSDFCILGSLQQDSTV